MIITFTYSWFRMTSGAVSEAVLVNLADTRYFQHGGNLMVMNCFVDEPESDSFLSNLDE